MNATYPKPHLTIIAAPAEDPTHDHPGNSRPLLANIGELQVHLVYSALPQQTRTLE